MACFCGENDKRTGSDQQCYCEGGDEHDNEEQDEIHNR